MLSTEVRAESRLDDEGAAAEALEAAAGKAHAQRGLQLRGGRRAPRKAPSIPALDEHRHSPAVNQGSSLPLT